MPTDEIVVLEDVKKQFGEEHILKGVSLICRKGVFSKGHRQKIRSKCKI